jgi:hypothetical protein
MPCNECPLEKALLKSKPSKTYKKEKCCPPVCETECCLPDCAPDCCTPAFQRLDKLRTLTSLEAISTFPALTGFTRAGSAILVPGVANGNAYNPNGTVASNAVDLTAAGFENSELAYYFVNAERYQTFESCGKEDQVIGWYVDTATGNLELYQALNDLNLPITINRLALDSIASTSLTSIQKQQLYELNVLYKLSLLAIERVGSNPKTEGNICEYTDKCGKKWLLLINRAGPFSSTLSAATNNTQWTFTGVLLC